ncbi:MAG: hypothetical protein CYG60_08495 [Actinobacteria bacterium]|nr:MAG: hypothetical protein CYG60_08495 [Actinomycetota bacterium]
MSEWYCPNEQEGDATRTRHQFFKRRHRLVVEKTFIGNGRQWGLDNPPVLEDEPVGEMVCQTCGAKAEMLLGSGDEDGGRG